MRKAKLLVASVFLFKVQLSLTFSEAFKVLNNWYRAKLKGYLKDGWALLEPENPMLPRAASLPSSLCGIQVTLPAMDLSIISSGCEQIESQRRRTVLNLSQSLALFEQNPYPGIATGEWMAKEIGVLEHRFGFKTRDHNTSGRVILGLDAPQENTNISVLDSRMFTEKDRWKWMPFTRL